MVSNYVTLLRNPVEQACSGYFKFFPNGLRVRGGLQPWSVAEYTQHLQNNHVKVSRMPIGFPPHSRAVSLHAVHILTTARRV